MGGSVSVVPVDSIEPPPGRRLAEEAFSSTIVHRSPPLLCLAWLWNRAEQEIEFLVEASLDVVVAGGRRLIPHAATVRQ
jgi:hypothetical protein